MCSPPILHQFPFLSCLSHSLLLLSLSCSLVSSSSTLLAMLNCLVSLLIKCTIIHYSCSITHASSTEVLKMFLHRILSLTTCTHDIPMTYHWLPTSLGLVQDCPNCNFANVLECTVKLVKCACIAHCSLVMSPFLHDFLKMQLFVFIVFFIHLMIILTVV